MINNDKIFYPTIDEIELGLDSVSLVENPAIEINFLKFSEEKKLVFKLANEDKMIVSGPALVPDKPIYRNDAEMGDYWIVFKEQTIKDIVFKYFKEKQMNNLNHEHTKELIKGTMIESWFSKVDKELGFDVPIGTWFCSYQIEDKDYWNNEIKTGKVNGFSIEGMFKLIKNPASAELSISEEESQYKAIKQMIIDLDGETILDYLKRDDIGVKMDELDLSEAVYEPISDDEFTQINLANKPKIYYRYWKKPGAKFDADGGTLTDSRTRDFCRNIISLGKYWTAQEIVNLSQSVGYSVFKYAGGGSPNTCRHCWSRVAYFKFLPKK